MRVKQLTFGDSTVTIVPSGWVGRYHVITEDPSEGDWDHEHEFLSEEKVCTQYNLKPSELEELEND